MAHRKASAPRGGGARQPRKTTRSATPRRADVQRPAPAPVEDPRTFRLGVIPGATPGRWVDRWHERKPHVHLELVPLAVAEQRSALDEGRVDAAIVRRPLEEDGLHVIAMYDELPVVVVASDSDLTVVDELEASDLAGSVLIVPKDDVLGPLDLAGTIPPVFEAPGTTEDAIATVATGVGVTVVPMSLARLHHRRDVTYRPLVGGPVSAVAFAWLRDRDSDDVQDFVGILRGRTANSSR
ncbi:LysR substrate-binding domain-containing protein [Microbacterium oryzae]|uniref:Transcriptional regulator n=1 Tax=Microbacterium oryzae TaxID=743009 RepID=A0A6I6E0F9_9MICO|nr:LysR substrate-binding domain-containing protein [Microbacterium oryzae]QGU27634.1 transcriptional regulator [Microbacterium oryzae]